MQYVQMVEGRDLIVVALELTRGSRVAVAILLADVNAVAVRKSMRVGVSSTHCQCASSRNPPPSTR